MSIRDEIRSISYDEQVVVEKIAIVHHDNDFYYTWKAVLGVIQETVIAGSLVLTKEQLAYLISALIFPMYVLHQKSSHYKNLDKCAAFDEKEHLSGYLKIEAKDLLVNDEVDKFESQDDSVYFFNGETFVATADTMYSL